MIFYYYKNLHVCFFNFFLNISKKQGFENNVILLLQKLACMFFFTPAI
jgi:hypothetical protein